jgi:hypothetical protein
MSLGGPKEGSRYKLPGVTGYVKITEVDHRFVYYIRYKDCGEYIKKGRLLTSLFKATTPTRIINQKVLQ